VKHGTGRKLVKWSAPAFFATPRHAAGKGSAPGALSPGAEPALEFNRTILPHLDGAYNLARYLTRDAALAEDAVQDAMLRAFSAFGQFRGGSARAWLFTIVRNCCRTAQGGGAGAMSLVIHESGLSQEAAAQMANHPDEGPTPEEQIQRKDMIGQVRQAVEAIPEPFREAVVLRDLEELSYAEIAEVTGVPIGTVMSRLARGRAILAKQLLPPTEVAHEQSRSAK
jgi:RNA polymerase sigma-70 factor (ECF subfamily)